MSINKKRTICRVIFPVFVVLLFTACGGGGGSSEAGNGSNSFDDPLATIQEVGVEGGTVTSPGGAQVSIPAGILQSPTTIMVKTMDSLDLVPPTGEPWSYAGGISLQPHGLSFSQPVIITIPLDSPQSVGREIALYYYDQTQSGWVETGLLAVVLSDGLHAQAQISHFSIYTLQPNGVSAEVDGVFGDIYTTASNNFARTFDLGLTTLAAFEHVRDRALNIFTIDDQRILNVPILQGDTCYQLIGFEITFDHQLTDIIGQTQNVLFGQGEQSADFKVLYLRDVDITLKLGTVEAQLVGSFHVSIYWATSAPKLDLVVIPQRVWAGDSAQLNATLSCGEEKMSGHLISFELEHSNLVGTLNQSLANTNAKGVAVTTVRTNENLRLAEKVKAAYDWQQPFGRRVEEISDFASLKLFALTGEWTLIGTETLRSCTDPENNGVFTGTGAVVLSQQAGAVTGGTDFPTFMSLFHWDVTRGVGDAFSIAGIDNYVDEVLDCSVLPCQTLTTIGSASFQGDGSIDTEIIELSWNGADQQGDTCVFDGIGTLSAGAPSNPGVDNPDGPVLGDGLWYAPPTQWSGVIVYESDSLKPWSETYTLNFSTDPNTGTVTGTADAEYYYPYFIESYTHTPDFCSFIQTTTNEYYTYPTSLNYTLPLTGMGNFNAIDFNQAEPNRNWFNLDYIESGGSNSYYFVSTTSPTASYSQGPNVFEPKCTAGPSESFTSNTLTNIGVPFSISSPSIPTWSEMFSAGGNQFLEFDNIVIEGTASNSDYKVKVSWRFEGASYLLEP